MRAFGVGLWGVAIVVAGLTGCSSNTASEGTTPADMSMQTTTPPPAATATSGSVSASAGAGTAIVSIDGDAQEIDGQVVCSANAGSLNIAIGQLGTGVAVSLAEDASKVTSVGLGNINGVALGYQEGVPGGTASATKDGKTYRVSGTATGIDMANPMQPTTKPFEIEVTCP